MLGRHKSPPNCRLYGGSAKTRSTLFSGSEASISRLSPWRMQSRGNSTVYSLSSAVCRLSSTKPPPCRTLHEITLHPGKGYLRAQRQVEIGGVRHVDPKVVLGFILVSEAGKQSRILYLLHHAFQHHDIVPAFQVN